MKKKRHSFGVCSIGCTIYVFGGYDGFNELDTIEKYMLKENKWSRLKVRLPNRMKLLHVHAFNENEIYIFDKGRDVWLFDVRTGGFSLKRN